MPENYFMGLVGVGIGGFILAMILRALIKKYGIFLSVDPGRSLKDVFTWAFNDPQIRKRILITAGALIALRIAFFLPLPGIDMGVVREFLGRFAAIQGGGALNAAMFFSDIFEKATVFALGLMPFFSSCIIIQLASAVIPGLRKLSFGGESGRARISKYTYIITIAISLLQSFFISQWLQNPARFEGMRLVTAPGPGFTLVCMLTMTAAAMLLLFIADIITRHGIGNGIAVIAVSYIPLYILRAVHQLSLLNKGQVLYKGAHQFSFSFVILSIICAGLVYAIYILTNRARIVMFQDNNSKKIPVYLRPTIIANAPVSFAQAVMFLPATVGALTGAGRLYELFGRGQLLYPAASLVLVAIFTYLYTMIVFDPKYILAIAGKFGCTLVKDNNNNDEDYLDDSMSKVLIMIAAFLAAIFFMPDLIMFLFKVPYLSASFFGGAGFLLAVGVFSDTIRQLEFLMDKSESGIKDWGVCYIAIDEIEAAIKSGYLKSKGIPALVEPLRFSWGMPIRTIVDQYRIYVPAERKKEARGMVV